MKLTERTVPKIKDAFIEEHFEELQKNMMTIHTRTPAGHLHGPTLIRALHVQLDFLQEKAKFEDELQCGRQQCSFCCHSEIFMTPSEAQYIKENATRYEIDKERQAKQRATEYTKLSFADKACIMLKDGRCQIYEHRPMVCRNHGAARGTDPEECHQQNIEQGKVFVSQPRAVIFEAIQFYPIMREPDTFNSVKNIADYEW
jgi:Fe-S-cluster containining protein